MDNGWSSREWCYEIANSLDRHCEAVADEVEGVIFGCEWYEFYDLLEGISHELSSATINHLNNRLAELGVPWHIVDGQVIQRDEDDLLDAVQGASASAKDNGMTSASSRLEAAWKAWHQRPIQDTSNTISNAISAIESAAREATNRPTETLGQLLGNRLLDTIIPANVADGVRKLWDYANEVDARHGKPGSVPPIPESRFILHAASASVRLLLDNQTP